jgi:hypothetical protein
MYHAQNNEMHLKTADGNHNRKTSFRISSLRWKDKIKMNIREIRCEDTDLVS